MIVSDNELLSLYVYRDDQKALERLVRRHASMVQGVCHSVLWQTADADDAFQAVFLLLSTKAPKLLDHNSIGGWIHEVAVRISLKQRSRIARKREVPMSTELQGTSSEPWQMIARSRDSELLHREVSRLPKRYRDAIVLCHLEGKSRAQAASILDVTTASLKGTLARGRKLLRQRLLRYGVATSIALGAAAIVTEKAAAAGVSESLIQSTMHHCQGLNPIEGIGGGPDIVQSLIAKDTSMMMTMGLSQTGFATIACVMALGLVSALALHSTKIGETSEIVVTTQPEDETTASEFETSTKQEDSAAVTNLNFEIMELQTELANLRAKFGEKHPRVLAVQKRLSLLRKSLTLLAASNDPIEQLKLPSSMPLKSIKSKDVTVRKAASETWEQYMNRLVGDGLISKDLVVEWTAGAEISIEYHVVESRTRTEKRERMVPATVMREEMVEGKPVKIPVVQNVRQTYEVQVPYSELVKKRLVIPRRGELAEDIAFPPEASPSLLPVRQTQFSLESKQKPQPDLSELARRMAPSQPNVQIAPIPSSKLVEVSRIKNAAGYRISHKKTGETIREFLDLDGDNKIDNWAYFRNGKEVYRDLDTDGDGKINQVQVLRSSGILFGIDENQDGKIDRWQKGE